MKKLIIALVLSAALFLTSCASLDVVQTDAIRAFEEIPTTDSHAIFTLDKTSSLNWDANNVYIKVQANEEMLVFSNDNGGNTAEEIITHNRSALTYNHESDYYRLAIDKATFSWPKNGNGKVVFEWEYDSNKYTKEYQL